MTFISTLKPSAPLSPCPALGKGLRVICWSELLILIAQVTLSQSPSKARFQSYPPGCLVRRKEDQKYRPDSTSSLEAPKPWAVNITRCQGWRHSVSWSQRGQCYHWPALGVNCLLTWTLSASLNVVPRGPADLPLVLALPDATTSLCLTDSHA